MKKPNKESINMAEVCADAREQGYREAMVEAEEKKRLVFMSHIMASISTCRLPDDNIVMAVNVIEGVLTTFVSSIGNLKMLVDELKRRGVY